MGIRNRFLGAMILATLVSCSQTDPTDPSSAPPTPTARSPFEAHAASAGGVATSLDADGVPRFIWARSVPNLATVRPGGSTPELASRDYLRRFAGAYGLKPNDVQGMEAAAVIPVVNGGTLVRMQQKLEGVEIYGGSVKVLLDPSSKLVAITGRPSRVTGAKPAQRVFNMPPGDAVAVALGDLYGVAVPAASASGLATVSSPFTRFDVPASSAVKLTRPAFLKSIYYPENGKLVPAYFTEFYSVGPQNPDGSADCYRYIVAANDGRVLEKVNLTADTAYNYRAYAETTGNFTPFDGPQVDYTPHPAGVPDGSFPAFTAANLVNMDGFGALPLDPWMIPDRNGTLPVQTVSNNVDAYADLFTPDGYSNGDLRATLTTATGVTPRAFDRQYNTAMPYYQDTNQVMASTTNLFYMINWMHDFWYDSGFTEAAGNAQNDNFGRGGADRDAINAEAQDFASLENANMSTPSDGAPPRMQMYPWRGKDLQPLAVTMTPAATGTATVFASGRGMYGPPQWDITLPAVLAADGSLTTTDLCQPVPAGTYTGQIVVVTRALGGAGCVSLIDQTRNAEAAGAAGVIMINSSNAITTIFGAVAPNPATIPTMIISSGNGTTLRNALLVGPVSVRLQRVGLADEDGAIDNQIVGHEWGHYLHHRLTNCTSYQCSAMSEGWADFNALLMTVRSGDNLNGTYAAGIYAPQLLQDSAYFGIRRFAYSVDPTKNALSFRHIAAGAALPTTTPISNLFVGNGNNEVHNAGEIWASTLFQAYIDLQKNPGGRTFDQVKRAFSNYVVLGLQLAPPNATMTETRDAILAAALALNPADMLPIAQSFALRGEGTCAVSPGTTVTTLSPVVESTSVQPITQLGSIELTDDPLSCDNDGYLDPGETGVVTVNIANSAPMVLSGATVTVSTTTAGVTFPGGAVANVPDIGALSGTSVSVPIALDSGATDSFIALTITLDAATACTTQTVQVLNTRINTDELPASSKTDDVEARATPWTFINTIGSDVWAITQTTLTNSAWHGDDTDGITDTALVSPSLQVSATDPFVVTFQHAFQFEFNTPNYWDGGVIEVSQDDGATWADVTTLGAAPGYNAPALASGFGNPLGGRPGYGNQNASYPATDTVTLNFGAMLAGKTVKLRFRIGSDVDTGLAGWTIDDLAFSGIDNTPFPKIVPHAGSCQVAPVASAGADRTVPSGAQVILDGSGTTDANGDLISYHWTQTAGPGVTLLNGDTVQPAFQAPTVATDTPLTFQLMASDALRSSTDSVTITVRHANQTPSANAGPNQTVPERTLVTLDGTGSTDADGDALLYTWTAPGGIVLSGTTDHKPTFMAPEVTADTQLIFSLVVSDGAANSTASTVTVTVQNVNRAPSASAGAPQTVDEGVVVTLSGSGTDPDGDTLTYLWTPPGGVTLSSNTVAAPTFTAPTVTPAGQTLSFTLTVTDPSNATSQSTTQVIVRNINQAPTANAGANQTVRGGDTVVLSGSGTDPDADALVYAWTAPAGITLNNTASPTPSFKAPTVTADTVLTFTLKVTDAFGLASANSTVQVTVAPSLSFPVADAGAAQQAVSRKTVHLDGSGSSNARGGTLTYAWTQVQGTPVTLTGADTATPSFPAPTVLSSGADVLTFELVVTNADGLDSSPARVSVFVVADATSAGNDGGCGCQVGGTQTAPSPFMALLGIPLIALIRRRRVK